MRLGLGRWRRHAEPATSGSTPLDGLLEDMRDLRLTLAADLSAAAGAAETGSADVAAQIVDADRRELASFVVAARDNLRSLNRERQDRAARRRRRWMVALPALPIAGAVAVSAAAATGALPVPHENRPSAVTAAGSSVSGATAVPTELRHFASVVASDPSASDVIAAASALHRHLRRLIGGSADPSKVAEARQLLSLETQLLLSKEPPGTKLVLSMTRHLAAKLQAVLPTSDAPSPLVLAPTTDPTAGTKHHHHRSTTTKVTDSPSPKPTQSPSDSPSPSQSPAPNPTPTIPTLPG